MKFINYYSELFKDNKINSELVTYLAFIHIFNCLANKDAVTNDPINALGKSYAKKFKKLFDSLNYPLSFAYDDILDMYAYTYPHLRNVLNNPHTQIIKEKKLIEKSRLKDIDYKTMIWLANKPGMNIREKLAHVDKVSSTVKRFTKDMKENQVMVEFYKNLKIILLSKVDKYYRYPEIFGSESNDIAEQIKQSVYQIDTILRNDFDEVTSKIHTAPNNALIGNVDYASIWRSYLRLKNDEIDYTNSFDSYIKIAFKSIMFYLMSKYEFQEKFSKLDEQDENYILIKKNGDSLTELKFTGNNEIYINYYQISDTIADKKDNKYFALDFVANGKNSDRGICYSLSINDKEIKDCYADLQGLKELIETIVSKLKIDSEFIIHEEKSKTRADLISIATLSNTIYGDQQISPCISINEGGTFKPNAIYNLDDKQCYLNDFIEDSYFKLLSTYSSSIDMASNNVLIYDIKDTYDQFSSAKLRRIFNAAFPHSYPVWRSILAAETIKDLKIKNVVDLCGNEMSLTALSSKNQRFVHIGAQFIDFYITQISERQVYQEYLNEYSNKYGILPNEIIKDAIDSGAVSHIFKEHKEYLKYYSGYYYSIRFDEGICNSLIKRFNENLDGLISEFGKNTIFVIPDIGIKPSKNIILNSDLIIGARTIEDRVKKGEVTWYEHLPELSLEVIRNGLYENVKITDNREIENIIGKSLSYDVKETFILPKGKRAYKLPLIKDFIGESNVSFDAEIKDPSFPLLEDIEVRLNVEYNFESENSYNLYFYPLKSNAPFSKIKATWVEQINDGKILNPDITDITYEDDKCREDMNAAFQGRIPQIIEQIESYNYFRQYDCRTIFYITNDLQRAAHFNNGIYKDYVHSNLKDGDYILSLKMCHKKLKNYYNRVDDPQKKIKIERKIKQVEEGLVFASLDKKLYTNKQLILPFATFGRYLSEVPDDTEVINLAYEFLLDCSRKKIYFGNKDIHTFIDRFLSSTIVDHLAFRKASEYNAMLCPMLLKFVVRILKELADYNWNDFETEDEDKNPRQAVFVTKFCLETIVSMLYCRDLPTFSDLKPGQKTANEIISYIKVINKKCFNAMENWNDINFKMPKFESRYKITMDKPAELNNMYDLIYVLILYLTGDERTDLIKIEDTGR